VKKLGVNLTGVAARPFFLLLLLALNSSTYIGRVGKYFDNVSSQHWKVIRCKTKKRNYHATEKSEAIARCKVMPDILVYNVADKK
jgi:hypothetical protein